MFRSGYKFVGRSALIGALLSILLISASRADNAVRFPEKNWDPYLVMLLKKGSRDLNADFVTGIQPPPENDSAETRADLDALLTFQETERTPDQIEAINFENRWGYNGPVDLMEHYGLFNRKTYPKTFDLLMAVRHDVDYFLVREKKAFMRARPTQLEPRLTAVIPIPGHPAYPSAHAGQNWAAALVMGKLDPVHKDAYEKLAIDIAHRREIAGVHYPSDSDAGRLVATNVVAGLLAVPRIAQMYVAAQDEMNQTKINVNTEDTKNDRQRFDTI